MSSEDNKYIIEGLTPSLPILNISLGKLLYNKIFENINNSTPAMVDAVTEEQLSYKEIFNLTYNLAKTLQLEGYGKNSIISICSENNLNYFIPIISALYIGATIAPINHFYTKNELIHALNITKPTLIFCSKNVYEKLSDLQKNELKYIKKIIIIDSNKENNNVENIKSFISKKNLIKIDFEIAKIDPEENVCFVMTSSGTTGPPKGVMLTHSNIMVRYMHFKIKNLIGKTDTSLAILPFFHVYGLLTNLMALIQTQKIIILKRFEPKSFLDAITKYKITNLRLAPPILVLLTKNPLINQYDLSHIKEIVCGAAPLNKQTEIMLKEKLNIQEIRQGYGLTEAPLAVLFTPLNSVTKSGSIGLVCPYMKVKVRNPDNGKSLGPYQYGELCIKGPMVMKGYYGNFEATKNAFTNDGWLRTGDVVYYDNDKYFFIVDRLKEIIKYNGFQVAPAELEAILLKNPQIKDAGVVGLAREGVGEVPVAFIVKDSNSKLTEKDIQDFVSEQVSAQKRLRGGVIFVDSIPKNPSGKILRRELRNLLINYKLET